MAYRRQKRKRRYKKYTIRKQIGRGKKLAKALIKNVGLPLLHRKIGSRKFKVPALPLEFRVKKKGNSYGLHGGMTFHFLPGVSKTFGKQVL